MTQQQPKQIAKLLAPLDTRSGRTANFDMIRLALAFFVLVSHAYLLSLPPRQFKKSDPLLWLTHGQMDLGGFAVNLFFVISGFLIANSWVRRPEIGNFLRSRFLRIYPGFAVATLFGLLVVGPLGTDSVHAYLLTLGPKNLVWMVFLASPAIPGPPVVFEHQRFSNFLNGSLWTLRYEFWCYVILVAAAGVGILRDKRVTIIAWSLTFVGYLALNHWHIHPLAGREIRLIGAPNVYPRFLSYFFAGVCVYQLRNRLLRCSLGTCVSLGILVISCLTGRGFEPWLAICGTWLLFTAAYAQPWKINSWLKGMDLSYGLYLYAYPVEQLIIRFVPGIGPIAVILASLPVSFVLAILSWKFVEEPCLRLKRSKIESGVSNVESNVT